MAKKISEEIRKQIPILYQELGNKSQVAKQLGISVSTVSKYLNLFEAAPQENERKARVKITDELIEQINIKYTECKNMSQVARELGIAPSTVKNHLNEENLNLIQKQNDDRDALFYYIYKLFGQQSEEQPVSKWNITQMQKFRSQGYPYRGQLLTLQYFFDIKKNSIAKSNGSIGIIPFVYEDAKLYYNTQAKKAEQVSLAIQKQLEQDRIEIKYNPNDYFGQRKKKKTIDLNTLKE